LIEIGSKTAEKNSAQTNKQTDRHYENNGHLAVNQELKMFVQNTAHWPSPCVNVLVVTDYTILLDYS